MNYRHFKYESWLYALAFLIALAVRLIGLGTLPLNDAEAQLALQSLQLADGLKPALGPHPAYILFTMPLFFLYGGGTNFLARLIPALIGSVLVFAPLLFTNRLKPRPSLLLAFFLALDPGMVAISRQVGSPILALTFFVFAWGFWNQNKPRLFASFGALALLGGPSIWAGLLGLGITWAIRQGLEFRPAKAEDESVVLDQADGSGVKPEVMPVEVQSRNPIFTTEILSTFAVTFIAAGTLFFVVPNGLSAALASIPAYLIHWIVPSQMQPGWMLVSLLAYQPFAVLLASIATIRGWVRGSRRVIPLSVWFLVAFLLAIFQPGRQMADLAWALLPLLGMAALELTRNVDVFPEERIEVFGTTMLTAFLWGFGWLNFLSVVWLAPGYEKYNLYTLLVFGSLFLLLLSLVLVAFGWSIHVAQRGAIWGLGLALGVLGLAGAMGVSGLHGISRPELWWQPKIPAQANLLEATVREVSEWGVGHDDALPVLIYGVDSPALEWVLREHNPIQVDSLDVSTAPALVVSNYEDNPNLSASYRGQDFTWRLTTSWEIAKTPDWFRWLAYREMPQSGEIIVLWARNDLFFDSK